MNASIGLAGTVAVVGLLVGCGRGALAPPEREIPVRAIEASGEQEAQTCRAEFVDPAQKKEQQDKDGQLVWLLTGDCPQAQITPTNFVLKASPSGEGEGDAELCKQGSPADADFEVTSSGRRATAELKREVQDQHPSGTRRLYCYTLILKAPNQADEPIDPEIEFIWP
jgi:hypothetical protein